MGGGKGSFLTPYPQGGEGVSHPLRKVTRVVGELCLVVAVGGGWSWGHVSHVGIVFTLAFGGGRGGSDGFPSLLGLTEVGDDGPFLALPLRMGQKALDASHLRSGGAPAGVPVSGECVGGVVEEGGDHGE